MWRLGLDTIGLGIVLMMLVTLMFAVLILQRQRTQKTIAVWLAAGLIGILLGSAGTLGALRLMGSRQMVVGPSSGSPGGDAASPAGMPAMGGSMGGMGAGMGGMGGGPGGGMGGMGGGSNPKRDLTTLVRKMDLLTGEIGIQLNQEQGASLAAALADIEKAEALSDDDAKAKHDAILALLDDAQKPQLDAIGLPRPQRGAGGGGPGGSAGPGGPPKEAPANPFQDEMNAKALQNLRERFAAKEAKSETAPAAPTKSENAPPAPKK
jgi:hypothetical protein